MTVGATTDQPQRRRPMTKRQGEEGGDGRTDVKSDTRSQQQQQRDALCRAQPAAVEALSCSRGADRGGWGNRARRRNGMSTCQCARPSAPRRFVALLTGILAVEAVTGPVTVAVVRAAATAARAAATLRVVATTRAAATLSAARRVVHERVAEGAARVRGTTVLIAAVVLLVGIAATRELRRRDVLAVVAAVDQAARERPVAAALQRARIAPEPVVAHPPACTHEERTRQSAYGELRTTRACRE
eukprot:833169-Prymnesium_polylepis.2